MRRFVQVLLPSIALGAFLARFLYELDPLRWGFLGGWPGTLLLIVAVVVALSLVTRRSPRLSLLPWLFLLIYVLADEVDLRWATILFTGTTLLVVTLHGRLARPRWFDLALAVGVLAIYLATLGDHAGRADTFEFQVVAPQLGIAHPTGYPLFIMLGKLFSVLPLGPMAVRLNLASAVFATGAIMLIYAASIALTRDRLISALAALALAASGVFWSQAVVAEVYTLNALFVAVIVWLLVRRVCGAASPARTGDSGAGRDSSSPPSTSLRSAQAAPRNDAVWPLALILGLALSHHLTSVILIPPVVLALLFSRPQLTRKQWLIAFGCLLIGLTPWLYIPLRWPALHDGALMPVSDWLGWIFGQRFGGALDLSLWNDGTRWGIITRIVVEQFGAAGAILAALGLVVLIKRAWRVALITLAAFAGYVFYGLVYNVPDVAVFIIPAFMVMALWLGVGASWLVGWWVSGLVGVSGLLAALWQRRASHAANRRIDDALSVQHAVFPSPRSSFITRHSSLFTLHASLSARYAFLLTYYPLLITLLALLPLTLIAGNWATVDQRGRDAGLEAWGRYVLSLPIPDRAAILADSEKIAPLYYLQVTEQLRPDLDILVLGDEAAYRRELDQRLAAGQPVYLARFLPNLPYRLRSLGPLVEVSGEPLMTEPNLEYRIDEMFGNDVRLLGATAIPGDPYRITLFWQAISAARANYHVRLRLVDADDQVWWEDRGAHPVSGYYPTGAWAQGEVVPDYHELAIEPFVPAGTYDLEVGLFTPFRDEGLSIGGMGDWLRVAAVTIAPRDAPPLPREVRIAGHGVITSLDEPSEIAPGRAGVLRFDSRDLPDATVHLSAGSEITSTVPRAAQTRLVFRAPAAAGVYPLMLSFDTPVRCGWLAPPTTTCSIGALTVAGEAGGDALNFDNQVLLIDAQIDRTAVNPGGTLNVDLTWRSLKTWPDNYTAFVHLIGPDGRVHGQVDQWPVQGTLPTSSWTAGQTVRDPYSVVLPADAPRGRYQVEVGWYLLATLRRLSVLDAAGQPTDDKVIIGEFDVP